MVLASGLSDVGCERDTNQDRISIELPTCVFVVADGMGGEQCGDLAAQIAVDSVVSYLRSFEGENDSWPFGYDSTSDLAWNCMATAIQLANVKIRQASSDMPDCDGMGSTVSALSVKGKIATIGTVGDSRVYLYRQGKLWLLTKDDSVVANMIDAGEISAEDARIHPMRNVLTQAAGKMESVKPQIQQIDLEHADLFLLSSDGLHGVLSHDALSGILSTADDLEATARKLIAEGRKLGAPDNLSCVLVEYLDEF